MSINGLLPAYLDQAVYFDHFAGNIECLDGALMKWVENQSKFPVEKSAAINPWPRPKVKNPKWQQIIDAARDRLQEDYVKRAKPVDKATENWSFLTNADGSTQTFSQVFRRLSQQALQLWHAENTAGANEKVRVAVIGDFSSGKSSFINSLLGEKLCPVNVAASTSCVTTFKYGVVKKVCMLEDGKEVEISTSDYDSMVTNPANGNNRYEFVVYYPFDDLNDISIIDTPGFNNACNDNDERITSEVMIEADVVFFVLDIQKGDVSADMMDLLTGWRDERPDLPLYAVINKSDTKPRRVALDVKDRLQELGLFRDVVVYSSKDEIGKAAALTTLDSINDVADFVVGSFEQGVVTQLLITRDNARVHLEVKGGEVSEGRGHIFNWFKVIHGEKLELLRRRLGEGGESYRVSADGVMRSCLLGLDAILKEAKERQEALMDKDKYLADFNEEVKKLGSCVDKLIDEIGVIILDMLVASLICLSVPNSEKEYTFSPYYKVVAKTGVVYDHESYKRVLDEVILAFECVFNMAPSIMQGRIREVKVEVAKEITSKINDMPSVVSSALGKNIFNSYYDYKNLAEAALRERIPILAAYEMGKISAFFKERIGRLDGFVNGLHSVLVAENQMFINTVVKCRADIIEFLDKGYLT